MRLVFEWHMALAVICGIDPIRTDDSVALGYPVHSALYTYPVEPIAHYTEKILLLLSSCQPSSHIRLMLFMEVAKEVTRFDRLSFQPWKMARWIAQHFIG